MKTAEKMHWTTRAAAVGGHDVMGHGCMGLRRQEQRKGEVVFLFQKNCVYSDGWKASDHAVFKRKHEG